MNTLVQDNLFLILFVVGAVLVSLHARGLYSTALPSRSTAWLSEDLQLRHLTRQRQYESGFLFYLSPLLLIYLLVSVSPELLSLSMGVAGTSASVGAKSLSASESSAMAPLLSAAAVIALSRVKPASDLEQYLRSVAHGIAGIPHYMQKMVRYFRQMDVQMSSLDETDLQNHLGNTGRYAGLQSDINAIHVFNEWTFGSVGGRIWSESVQNILEASRPRMAQEYQLFTHRLSLPAQAGHTSKIEGDGIAKESNELVRLARSLRAQYAELLAIAAVNQNERLPRMAETQKLANLVHGGQRMRAGNELIRLLYVSSLSAFVISLSLTTLFYLTATFLDDAASRHLALGLDGTSLYIRGLSTFDYYQAIVMSAFQTALRDTIGFALIFMSGSTAGLLYRLARKRIGEWEVWRDRCHPVGQYVVICLLAVAFSACVYEAYLFFSLVVWPSASIVNSGHFATLLSDFNNSYLQFGLFSLLAAPGAICVCLLSDMLDASGRKNEAPGLSPYQLIVWFSLFGGVCLYLVIMYLMGQQTSGWNIAVGAFVPVVALFCHSARYWQLSSGFIRSRAGRPVLSGVQGWEFLDRFRKSQNSSDRRSEPSGSHGKQAKDREQTHAKA